MTEELKRLIELGEKLPKHLRSDWDGTNHYELTSSAREDNYWWLIMGDLFRDLPKDVIPCDTEDGKRLGLIMDIAVALQESLPALKEAVAYQENVKEYCDLAKEYKEKLKDLPTGLET